MSHSDLDGTSGMIESPIYPKYFTDEVENTYRIIVKQGSVIRIEFPQFYMDEEDEDDCYAFIKIYNGFDDEAPILEDEMCGESPQALTTETNVAFISFSNQFQSKTKFKISWKEVDKVKNNTGENSECGDEVISLNNVTTVTNITSPGYPHGYTNGLTCTWTIMSGVPGYHPHIHFNDIDLEDTGECYADYILLSTDRTDGSWRDIEKVCATDLRTRKTYEGTPNLKVS
jgi:cubilin